MNIAAGVHFRHPGKPVEIGERVLEPTFIIRKVSRHGIVYYGIEGERQGWVQALTEFRADVRAGRKIIF